MISVPLSYNFIQYLCLYWSDSRCVAKRVNNSYNNIFKKNTDDVRVPLNYQGITLLSICYKIFTTVLNNRVVKWLEEIRILLKNKMGLEQNGVHMNIYSLLHCLLRAEFLWEKVHSQH